MAKTKEMRLKRNYNREGLLAKGSKREWWTAYFTTVTVHVYQTSAGEWGWSLETVGNFIKGEVTVSKAAAYEIVLGRAKRLLSLNMEQIDHENIMR